MKVTKADVMFGLERLLELYHRPRHLPAEPEGIAAIWYRELSDLDVELFRAGVSAYCKTAARYFPTPGELRDLGTRVARPESAAPLDEMAAWEKAWPERSLKDPLPCPGCGAIETWAMGPAYQHERRFVPHDPAKHQAAGIPFVGGSLADLRPVPA